MKKLIIAFTLLILFTLLNSFNKLNYINEKKSTPSLLMNDSVKISQIRTNNGIEVTVKNLSKTSLFLFSSYLDKTYIKSKYLHRIDKKRKIKKISFLPLTPFLSPIKSDNIILNDEALIKINQINYEFIEIFPNDDFKFELLNEEINVSFFSKEIDFKNLNMFSKIKFKEIKNCKKYDSYKNYIEFAVFDDITILEDKKNYHLNTYQYNLKANDYKVISVMF